MRAGLHSALAGLALAVLASPSMAQDIEKVHIKAVGATSTQNQYKLWEKPFFETVLPEKSGGQITADILASNEMGLQGAEVLKLLRMGVLDIMHGTVSYFAGEDPAFEGIDLAGLAGDIGTAREISDAYKPVLAEILEEKYNTKLLALAPISSLVYFCKPEVRSLADLKGKKVRVFNTSMADYVSAVGGANVNIPFAEVLPSMQRGVADCAITGTSSGNTARWWEVTDYLYTVNQGWAVNLLGANADFWNGMNDDTRAFLEAQFSELESNMWTQAELDIDDGVRYNVAEGACDFGIVAENPMTLSEPSEADLEEHRRIVAEVVVPAWAARADAETVRKWNETVGKVIGVTAGN